MRVLSVDTTTAYGSVALLDGDCLTAICGVGPEPHHAENLMPMVDAILGRVGWTLDDLDGLAVASGPGSFTGLKIGIASMEGLSMATELPVVGVGSLLATSWPYRHASGCVVSVMRAYRGEVYAAAYVARAGGKDLEAIVPPVCETPERFTARLPEGPLWLVGTGASAYRDRFETLLGPGDRARFGEASYFLAEAVARLGADALKRGESGVQALYVRPSEAERNRDRARTES